MEESYIQNCYIKPRLGDSILLGTVSGDRTILMTLRLDGYAIIPREEYEELQLLLEKCQK